MRRVWTYFRWLLKICKLSICEKGREETNRELLEEILTKENLNKAYKQVYQNKGSSEIEGITVEESKDYLKKYKEEIITNIRNRKYKPQLGRRVEISKRSGKKKKQEIPSMEEVRKTSRISKNCGSNSIEYFFWMILVNFLSISLIRYNIDKEVIIVLLYLGLAIIILLYCVKKLNLFQRLSTREPEDKEIEVALAALKEWEKQEYGE